MLKAALVKNPKYPALQGAVESLSYEKDNKQIYFKLSDKGPSAEDVVKSMLAEQAPEPTEAPVAEVAVAVAAPAPVAVAAPAPVAAAAAGGGDGGAEVNAPPSALDAIRVILAG